MPALPERFFAVGEEKTILKFPGGYGYQYKTTDHWLLDYMLHNLTSNRERGVDHVRHRLHPGNSPAAKNIMPARPIWMDVQNGETYPVFDVPRGGGHNGEYTYPDDAKDPVPRRTRRRTCGPSTRTARCSRPPATCTRAVCATTSGCKRAARSCPPTRRSRAPPTRCTSSRRSSHYYEPAGPVSWDVTMSATPDDWRVQVHKGDKLSITATYESKLASWYEGMGIMVVWMAHGTRRHRSVHHRR